VRVNGLRAKASMKKLAAAWRSLFDIRPGEYRRTTFMSLYLFFVLFSYYVLKSASESMFLNKFDIDKLPNLYILMAIFGGALAFVYSKTAAAYGMPLIVELGVFFDVLVAGLIIGIFTHRLQDTFDSVDTSKLTELRE
jgi:ATP/ADP translocase